MDKFLYNFDKNKIMKTLNENDAVDTDFDLYRRINKHMVMDVKTGQITITSAWDEKKEDGNF